MSRWVRAKSTPGNAQSIVAPGYPPRGCRESGLRKSVGCFDDLAAEHWAPQSAGEQVGPWAVSEDRRTQRAAVCRGRAGRVPSSFAASGNPSGTVPEAVCRSGEPFRNGSGGRLQVRETPPERFRRPFAGSGGGIRAGRTRVLGEATSAAPGLVNHLRPRSGRAGRRLLRASILEHPPWMRVAVRRPALPRPRVAEVTEATRPTTTRARAPSPPRPRAARPGRPRPRPGRGRPGPRKRARPRACRPGARGR